MQRNRVLDFNFYFRFFIVVTIGTLINACSTIDTKLSNNNAVTSNYWSRTVTAAKRAASDPGSWGNLLAAAAIGSSKYDTRWANKIRKSKPLFSNTNNVSAHTDTFRSLSYVGMYTTAVFIPNSSFALIGKTALIETSALAVTRTSTRLMNENISRQYPNGEGFDSMGSHHAASPFAAAALTRRNVSLLNLPSWGKYTINTSSYVIASASAWGRIEMGLHYPSDQLTSAAVGNFLALLIHDTFLPSQANMEIMLNSDYSYVGFKVEF